MKIPVYVEFHNNCNLLLCEFLKAVEPQEGCAILIGNKKTSLDDKENNFWEIKNIWQCSNVWEKSNSRLCEPKLDLRKKQNFKPLSKRNRFEIDAKDQIAAQRWARKNNLETLCCAHSHPLGKNIPSKIDLLWHHSPGLMVIADRHGYLKAWWIENKDSFHKVKVEFLSLK